ncbi:hypothetical protein B0T09DRAFT_359213 [Sordaria sp. MPI-SDFR-AT-0083]|nr:hypothetical protein B0T09DRAFT_359213 [Sordaria sp. MPI-SDFR-AT-0083]
MSFEAFEGSDADPWAVPKFTEGTNVSRVIPRTKPPGIEKQKDSTHVYCDEVTEYFKWRRHGTQSPSSWDGATMDRRVKSRIKKVPIRSPWKGPENFSGVARHGRTKLANWPGGGPAETALSADARSRWLEKQLLNLKMRHVKVLGWGGLGVVNLFEQERPDGELIKVVCKVDIEGDKGYLATEIRSHLDTAGAKHVAQRIPPGHFSRPNGRPIQPALNTGSSTTRRSFGSDLMMTDIDEEAELDNGNADPSLNVIPVWATTQVLFLEFMSRGDLRKISARVASHLVGGGNFPPLTLWHIFSNRGKSSIYAPEQFTEEWDHVKEGGPRESGATTAGNYNWWTNLYQVGIIMYSLIQLCEFETSPVPNYAAIRYPDGSEREVWGYGMGLLVSQYSNLDFDLVNAVAACLCHDPADRPDMHDLERLTERKVSSQPPDGPAAQTIRNWGRLIFEGAPAPRYDPAAPTGRERLGMFQDFAPIDSGGDRSRLAPAWQATSQQRAASAAKFQRQQQHGVPAGREQEHTASAAVVTGGQQPGLQTGRGQPYVAPALRGQHHGAPVGRGQQQPGLQPGRNQPYISPALRGQGHEPQTPVGRRQQ